MTTITTEVMDKDSKRDRQGRGITTAARRAELVSGLGELELWGAGVFHVDQFYQVFRKVFDIVGLCTDNAGSTGKRRVDSHATSD